jgi:serine/threonine-protein kinase RsbT
MNGLDVLQKSQQSERSSRWAGAWPTVRVPIGSPADIVVARQQGRALAIAMNFSTTDSAFIATTVSELARALLSHTVRGEIWLHEVHEDERTGVVIVARDPVAHDGWRHGHRAPVPDLELPDVCRLVDEFDIASDAGRGTTIRATKWCRRRSRVTGG